MKKLTVLLTVLIVLSNISICSFAFETTDDERDAYKYASEFLNKFHSNVYFNTEYDLSRNTIVWLDEQDPRIKNEVLEKAKEYEDEIRDNHHYRFNEDRKYIPPDENGDLPPAALADLAEPAPVCKQYDNTAIEDVLSSFPVYIEKKVEYKKVAAPQDSPYIQKAYQLFVNAPNKVTVSESGFAFVRINLYNVLLYKYDYNKYFEMKNIKNWRWVVCDVSKYDDLYDEKYRFHSEDMDVEKELLSEGYRLPSENEDNNTDTDTYTDTYTDSPDESDNEAQNSPEESEPINYIPWVICGIESVAIIALVIALVFKRKNNIREVENKNILSE